METEKTGIRWNELTRQDAGYIGMIGGRAIKLIYTLDRMTIEMDISAAHLGMGLDLDGLLTAPVPDFVHDIMGINANIDRTTGEMLNCFVPRYAARVQS